MNCRSRPPRWNGQTAKCLGERGSLQLTIIERRPLHHRNTGTLRPTMSDSGQKLPSSCRGRPVGFTQEADVCGQPPDQLRAIGELVHQSKGWSRDDANTETRRACRSSPPGRGRAGTPFRIGQPHAMMCDDARASPHDFNHRACNRSSRSSTVRWQ